jgi:predicted nucleic acid-binding protein
MNVDEISGPFFIDTNIVLYSFDAGAPAKAETAKRIIEYALRTQRGMISSQVLQEFLNAATKKFTAAFQPGDLRLYSRNVLMPLCGHYPSDATFDHALVVHEETGYSLYDSLIVCAALESGCTTLLSEDLQHGRRIQNMAIVNPFLV